MRGFGAPPHYIGVENQVTSFLREVAAIRASAEISATDAICRIPKLRRAFTAETTLMSERLQRLEVANDSGRRPVTRRMLRWFWCGLALVSTVAFAAGYLVSLRQ